jgi:L-ascorbate metabolism protein UlaG (beta-lactamase superfamily)
VQARAAITWVGHATVLVDLDGTRVITDPVLRDRVGALQRVAASAAPGVSEGIDLVLLSHLHADHADLPSLRRLARGRPRVFAPRGAAAWLAAHGIENVSEMSVGEELRVGPLRVAATPAVHDGRRRPLGAEAAPVGFVVRGSRSAYFAGDTDLFEEMDELAGTIDVALLPVWGWGRTLGPGHLDPDRAARAAARIAPGIAVPIHWGTLAPARPLPRLRDPAWPVREFVERTARTAPGVEVRVLQPGERTELP